MDIRHAGKILQDEVINWIYVAKRDYFKVTPGFAAFGSGGMLFTNLEMGQARRKMDLF